MRAPFLDLECPDPLSRSFFRHPSSRKATVLAFRCDRFVLRKVCMLRSPPRQSIGYAATGPEVAECEERKGSSPQRVAIGLLGIQSFVVSATCSKAKMPIRRGWCPPLAKRLSEFLIGLNQQAERRASVSRFCFRL